MKSLSKKQEDRRQKIIGSLQESSEKLAASIRSLNAGLETAFAEVEKAQEDYNAIVGTAEEFRDEVNSAQSDYFEDKSEGWQEGGAGSAYSEWKDSWEEAFERIEIEPPLEIELSDDDTNHADRLSDLSSEAGV